MPTMLAVTGRTVEAGLHNLHVHWKVIYERSYELMGKGLTPIWSGHCINDWAPL